MRDYNNQIGQTYGLVEGKSHVKQVLIEGGMMTSAGKIKV